MPHSETPDWSEIRDLLMVKLKAMIDKDVTSEDLLTVLSAAAHATDRANGIFDAPGREW